MTWTLAGHIERKKREHKLWLSMMAAQRKRDAERPPHGPYTANPEPPGDGDDWKVVGDGAAFAAAGLCELWRMNLGDETAFFRFRDFPPDFNFSGMWWRKAL
jgi:hypothetical protein